MQARCARARSSLGFQESPQPEALWLLQILLPTMFIYTQAKSVTASAILLACATALAETPEALVKQALQRNPELNFFVAEITAA